MKTINVVAAIIIENNRLFAVQRGYGEFKDYWEFPGGKIEPGEDNETALIREVREELNTEIKIKALFDTVDFDYPSFHLHMYCYLCDVLDGDLILLEHKDSRWLTKNYLNSVLWLPADLKIIENLSSIL